MHDLGYAWRRLRQRPGFLAAAVLTISLGIAFNTIVFAFLNAAILAPLPIADPSRVYDLSFGQFPSVSYPNYLDIRARNQIFTDIAAHRLMPMAISGSSGKARAWGYYVTSNYFQILGVRPWRGRFLMPSDEVSGTAAPVAVISYDCWRRRFGADPSIVGSQVRINGFPLTVIGIAPPAFIGIERIVRAEIWAPMSLVRQLEGWDWRQYRANQNAWSFARLRPGISVDQANASLRPLAASMAKEHPEENTGIRMELVPPGLIGNFLRSPVRAAGIGLTAVAALTLLVVCTNLAGLLLVHATARSREIAIRYALGAGRSSVLRMMFSECLIIASAGAILGFTAAAFCRDLISAALPAIDIPINTEVLLIDWRVAAFAAAVAVLSTLAAGVLPGLKSSRIDVAPALKSESTAISGGGWSLRDLLVGIQVAVCIVLLTAAVMMGRAMLRASSSTYGMQPANAVTLRVDLDLQQYSKEQGSRFQSELLRRARALPAVEAAGLASSIPFAVDKDNNNVEAEGAPAVVASRRPDAHYFRASPDAFRALGTRLLLGREFSDRDTAASQRVAIVNAAFADQVMQIANPIGRRFRTGAADGWLTIVGVVETGKYSSIGEAPHPVFWTPYAQDYTGAVSVVVRTPQNAPGALAALRGIVSSLDRDLPVFDAKPLGEYLDVPLLPVRLTTAVLGAMALVAVFLSALGLYSVLVYATNRRMREIGIRMALGAGAWNVVRPVMSRTGITVAVGLLAGVGLSLVSMRLLGGLLDAQPTPATYTLGAVVVTLTCVLASAIPMRRALRIDPMEALRQE